MEKEKYRVDEVAKMFDVNRSTIYRWIEEGRLNAKKIGGSTIRILHNELEKIIKDTNE